MENFRFVQKFKLTKCAGIYNKGKKCWLEIKMVFKSIFEKWIQNGNIPYGWNLNLIPRSLFIESAIKTEN